MKRSNEGSVFRVGDKVKVNPGVHAGAAEGAVTGRVAEATAADGFLVVRVEGTDALATVHSDQVEHAEDEHVFLVAATVGGKGRDDARRLLFRALNDVRDDGVDSWWEAEDDRQDGSDNDSAVFVHPGATATAHRLLFNAGLSEQANAPRGDSRFEEPRITSFSQESRNQESPVSRGFVRDAAWFEENHGVVPASPETEDNEVSLVRQLQQIRARQQKRVSRLQPRNLALQVTYEVMQSATVDEDLSTLLALLAGISTAQPEWIEEARIATLEVIASFLEL